MTSFSTLAVAAPMHTEIAANHQVGVSPVSVSNYVGGAAILTVLAVMLASGLATAGITTKKHGNIINPKAGHPAH